MGALLPFVVFISSLVLLHCTLSSETGGFPPDTLKRLSQGGEKYVDEEMKRALIGVKHMKEVMERNEEKHEHLMQSLRHSIDKKKGAEQTAKGVELKLKEAEQLCQNTLKNTWGKCQPCLEDACKTFYTSTCRRGFSSFSFKVEEFFRKMSFQFQYPDSQNLIYDHDFEKQDMDQDLEQVEDSFSRLQSKVRALYANGLELVSNVHRKLDHSFQAAFASDVTPTPPSPDQAVLDPGFFQGIKLDDVLDSFYDFGKSVIKEFSSVITDVFDEAEETAEDAPDLYEGRKVFPLWVPSQSRQLCRDLRRQTAECWQLRAQCESCQGALSHDCPRVRELYVELNDISQRLNVSRQQYEEVLQIVQRHTDDTITWLTDMAGRFSWVAMLANKTMDTDGVFSIAAVLPHIEEGDDNATMDTTVELNIFNSPTLTLNVPAELQVEDPAFMQYVAQEALGMYKQMMRNSLT